MFTTFPFHPKHHRVGKTSEFHTNHRDNSAAIPPTRSAESAREQIATPGRRSLPLYLIPYLLIPPSKRRFVTYLSRSGGPCPRETPFRCEENKIPGRRHEAGASTGPCGHERVASAAAVPLELPVGEEHYCQTTTDLLTAGIRSVRKPLHNAALAAKSQPSGTDPDQKAAVLLNGAGKYAQMNDDAGGLRH